jgi:hypothetical protein
VALCCAAVSRHRTALAALTAGAIALGAASTAPAKPEPARCKAPKTGFHSCLSVLYKHGAGELVEQVRVSATLLRRVADCPRRTGRRTVVLTRDGDALATARRAGRCAKGVMSWRVTFATGRTRGWELRDGDTVEAAWTGVPATTAVAIEPRRAG